jgi:hypothetical protein
MAFRPGLLPLREYLFILVPVQTFTMVSRMRGMREMELLSEVAVLQDMPEKGLIRGQVGTVVELLAPSVAEVEFSDDQGRTYAMAALHSEELIRLHRRPYEQVA